MPDKDFHRISTALTLDPHPAENLVGYMFRLADYRQLSSAHMLMEACGFDMFVNQPHPAWMVQLAAVACVDETVLWAISYGPSSRTWATFRGQVVSQIAIERRGAAHRRICPRCIAEIPIQRAIWDLRYVSICPIHRVALIDTCQICARPIRWVGRDLTRCTCPGRPEFSSFLAEEAATEDVYATAAVYGLMGDQQFQNEAEEVRSRPPFRDLAGANIAEFLYRLGLEKMGRLKGYFSSQNPGSLLWEAHVVMRRGLEAVTPWPSEFYRTIDEMRARSDFAPSKSMKMAAGAVERWQAGLPEGQGTAIQKAVQEYRAIDRKRGIEDR